MNFKELAKSCHTEHFTGADLKALLYNAQLQAAHDALDRKQKNLDSTSQVSLSATPISSPESSVKSLKNANPLVFSFSSKSGVIRHTEIPKEIEQKVGPHFSHTKTVTDVNRLIILCFQGYENPPPIGQNPYNYLKGKVQYYYHSYDCRLLVCKKRLCGEGNIL